MKRTLAIIAVVLVVITSLEAFGLTTDSETPLISEYSELEDSSDVTLEEASEAPEIWEQPVNQVTSDPSESEPFNDSEQDQSERDQPSEDHSQEAMPSSTGASIRIHQLQGRYEYLSGEVIQFHVGATLDGVFPVGTVFEIRIPRRHISDTATFQVSAISGQTPPTITRTENATTGEFIIRYTLNVTGGLEFDLPIQMSTHNGNTPNGFEIPIVARLIDSDETLLGEEAETTFTINTVRSEVTKRVMETWPVISGYRWSALNADHVTVGPAGLESMTRPGYLSDDFRELVPVSFTYHLNSPGTFGNRIYENLVFYDTIPEGALFVQELNPGWTFDEQTRVARFERNINTTLNSTGIGSGDAVGTGNFTLHQGAQILHQTSPVLRLYFPSAPIGEVFANEVRVTGRGLGTDCDIHPLDCFDLSDEISFSLGAESRRFNGAVSKTPNENPAVTATNNVMVTSNRTLGENTRGSGVEAGTRNYTINVTHRVSFAGGHTNNPSHLPLLPLQNVVVRDHSLDPALYFRGITIPARDADVFTRTSPSTIPEIFGPREPGTLDVHVLLVDGTSVTLAEDITITTARSFDFSDFGFDPEDVVEFTVEATEGSYFLPPPSTQVNENRLQITVHTGPRDPEEQIVPSGETGRALQNSVTMDRNTLHHSSVTSSSTGTLAYRLVEPVIGLVHGPTVRRNAGTALPNLLGSTLTSADTVFRIGERRHFRLDVNMMNILAGTSIETDQILVLLPEGLEFIPGSVEFHTMAATQSTMSSAQLNQEVEVIPDFNGTGETALRFNLRPFSRTGNVAGTQTAPVRAFSIIYQVEVTEVAATGTQISPAHLHWTNRDEVTPAVLPLNATGGNIANLWTSRSYLVPDVHDLAGDGEESIISEGQARVSVHPPSRQVSFTKATPRSMTIMTGGQHLTNMLGDEITYVLTIGTQGTIPGDVLETNVIVDLLPVGMEFIPGSQTVTHFVNSSSTMTNASIAPEVVENYRGTGQTALIFPLDEITLSANFSITTTTQVLRITYSTRITSLVEGGANVNAAYLSWTNRDDFLPGTFTPPTGVTGFAVADVDRSTVLDVWDLNGTGDPADTIIRSRATIHYTPPFELLMFKEVRGNADSNFLTYPAAGRSEVGTHVDYRLRLFNNSPGDIHPANFQVIDVLPFAGDHRGSTFTPTLAGSLTLPDGYRAYYTTDAFDPTSSLSSFVANANWTSTVADYSEVVAIRIEMNDGHVLTRGTQVAFEMRLNLPDDPDFTRDDLAVNTFYTSTTGGTDYILSNEAHLRFTEFTVDGYVFHDLDDNGILDHEVDRIFANHVVELIRITATGYEVVDTTTTDERGFYRFTTIRPGNYQIRVHPPGSLDHITENVGGPYGATAFDPDTSRSVTFTLNGENQTERVNAGFEGQMLMPITGLSDDLPLYLSLVTMSLTALLLLRLLKRKKQKRYES